MGNFNDKVILITGAASGFGKLLAEKLSAQGAKLLLADRNEAGVNAIAAQLQAARKQASALPAIVAVAGDVSKEAQVKAMVDAAINHFGRLDIAINNAGIATPMKSLLEVTEAEMDINFAVNTKGVFFGMKYQIPPMIEQGGGCILNIASMAGIGGAPKLTPYAASKHATVGISKTAALEFAKKNVRVNAICPFFSPTPMITDGPIADRQERLAQGSPMKRLGRPDEMVATMLMLIDPDNSYMTGQAIAVDGGVSAS